MFRFRSNDILQLSSLLSVQVNDEQFSFVQIDAHFNFDLTFSPFGDTPDVVV
jgi:hypothetical protein